MPRVDEQSTFSGCTKLTSIIPWLAGSLVVFNVLLLLPSMWWLITGVTLLPLTLLRHFDPNAESNLFTWYSSLLLILVAVTAFVNFGLDSVTTSERSWFRYAWLGIGGVSLFLSLDEVAMIHETVQGIMRDKLAGRGNAAEWARHYGRIWILVYAPAILAVVWGFLYVFLRLLRRQRGPLLCALGGLIIWVFSLVLEFFYIDMIQVEPGSEALEIILEEGCEIFGTSALLVAFAWHACHKLSAMLSVGPGTCIGPRG